MQQLTCSIPPCSTERHSQTNLVFLREPDFREAALTNPAFTRFATVTGRRLVERTIAGRRLLTVAGWRLLTIATTVGAVAGRSLVGGARFRASVVPTQHWAGIKNKS